MVKAIDCLPPERSLPSSVLILRLLPGGPRQVESAASGRLAVTVVTGK